MRKPRPLKIEGETVCEVRFHRGDWGEPSEWRLVLDGWFSRAETDKLEKWLVKAAAWIREREGK